MRTVLLIGAIVIGSGAAAAAPDKVLPVRPGSSIFWTSAHDGGSDKFRETVIAQGDDFEIYRNDGEWSDGGVADHFALFSGIYFASCDTEMPTAEERAEIAGLWPLTSGASVELSNGNGARFEIGVSQEFFMMGKTWEAHTITGEYSGDEPSAEELIVLDEFPLTVAVYWEDGTKDTATLVTKPTSVASTQIDTDLIGNCASLLNNLRNKN